MRVHPTKYNIGDKFRTKKGIITINGFGTYEGKTYYFVKENNKQYTDEQLGKLEKIKS